MEQQQRFTATSSKNRTRREVQFKRNAKKKRRINAAARYRTRNRGRIGPRIPLPLHQSSYRVRDIPLQVHTCIMLLPRRTAGPGLSFKTFRYPLAFPAFPSSLSSPLRSSSCRCGCRNSSVCSCSCCVHPASSASLAQSSRAYTSCPSSASSSSSSLTPRSCCPSSSSSSFSRTPTQSYSTTSTTMEYKLKDLSSLSDIPNMEKVESEVDGIEGGKVLVLRFNDQVHAMSPRCTHYGAPLKLGVVAPDGRLTCPWHGGMSSFY